MTEINPKLVADLARLAVRYEPGDWAALAKAVQDKEYRDALSALLDELAQTSARRRSAKRPDASSPTRRVRDQLASIREVDPARADVLQDLWMRLRSRELLAEMPAVRSFSGAVGMKKLVSRRREQAISEVVSYLSTLPDEGLQTALSKATMRVDRTLGDEYEKWVALILNRQPQPPSA